MYEKRKMDERKKKLKEWMEERTNKESRKKTEVMFLSALCFISTLNTDSKIQWKNRDQVIFLADENNSH